MTVPTLEKCTDLPSWPQVDDIYIARGSTWPITFEHQLPDNCIIESARFSIRRFDQGQLMLATSSIDNSDQWQIEDVTTAAGQPGIKLTLTKEQTECLPEGRWCYSIDVQCENGDCYTIKYGRVTIIGHQTGDYNPRGLFIKCELKSHCKCEPITDELTYSVTAHS